ncbi:MAG: hypothetical protein AAFS07_11955 [Pseudomonadota bacterium]
MPRDFIETVVLSTQNLIAEDMPAGARHDALVDLLHAWLSPNELAELTNAAIAAGNISAPPPAFEDMASELDSWAALASQHQLALIAWHTSRRLPPARRAGLVHALMTEGGSKAAA